MKHLVGLSLGEVFAAHARERGNDTAVSLGAEQMSYAELDARSVALAHHYLALGVAQDSFVTIAEPNSFEFLVACIAAWKVGAIPQPVSSRLPAAELEAIVELADAAVVVGLDHASRPSVPREMTADAPKASARLPERTSAAWKAPTSGGSTGRPKLIVSGDTAELSPGQIGMAGIFGAATGETMVMPGPLYHNGPFIWSWLTLFMGGHLALLPRFDPEATLAAVDEHRATALYLVPTMMQRMWKLPDDTKAAYDLSSLQRAFHLAEPCPKWLKLAWIDWIGPDALWELYGGTEGQSATVLDGNEWLAHEGSVGQPMSGEMKICADDGTDLPPGEIGEVWMRATGRETPTYRYIGAEAEASDDGWECLGDIGWMDADGYLYLADRRTDMILVAGANVFPAEIEAALNEHPGVQSSAVIGLPDDDKGQRVHAIVEADPALESDLAAFVAARLVRYKLPRTFEFVGEPLRDDAGKVRRSALRAERLTERAT